jgi:hypothetical protein
MDERLNPALLSELRYALDVMEDNSHLGLDDEYASKIRSILVHRIFEAERSLTRRSVAPVPAIPWKSKLSA